MPIITLTTDWNKNDYYIGAVKGAILNQYANAIIIDISHQIKPFNIFQAAFILKNCYTNYPAGTIHIIGVKSDYSAENQYMVVQADNQYFISTDNGIFSLLFDDLPVSKYIIDNHQSTTFPELHVFVRVACEIMNGAAIESFGKPSDRFVRRVPLYATIEESVIIGSIVHIDSYQNAITNITSELFEQVGKGRAFKIFVQSNGNVISKINKSYQETSPGELLAIFNSINLLEIAINEGNVAELLGLNTNSTVRIKFK
ncbi:MAG: hypothetical protein A2W99_04305 [Bacteroidetes bacterium GWF2_33_16]|nr:MAG: hypothetical protein A2X00_16825 [Bacteroidetes bacterium GWE2_32_14]OFY05894.1 MAG: hypothetical protein A2W99_04305 [Bacteroidetes bacterium GWF2_33_16]